MPQVKGEERRKVERRGPPRFSQLVGFWVPRRFVSDAGIDIGPFLADINEKIERRGFVLYDGQILTRPLDSNEPIDPVFEPESLGHDYEIPERRVWQAEQQAYFGLDDPYQMDDEGDTFTWSSLVTSVVGPYLESGELIAALLHGARDNSYFTCTCHYSTVVYTTKHRLVCMSCGANHFVLREPLALRARQLLTGEEWDDFFDEKGSRHHEEVDLPTVDFREIENAATIWTTSQWDEASHDFIFFARSSPEEIAEAIRGTEADPSILLEAGWSPVPEPPPPALQLMCNSIDVSLGKNAEHAFADGVSEFLAAFVHPDRLVHAIPQLFRAIELLLKARLEMLDSHGLEDQPNNPTVIDRLRAGGVNLAPEEIETITRLRRLRNDLQHGEATFNHRTGLALCRRGIVFVDRFADDELGTWTAAAIRGSDWYALLDIPEIAARAERIVDAGLKAYREDHDATITSCPRCEHETMLRPHPAAGASCAYCGHVPVVPDEDG
jgi:hypothetical protein